MVFRRPEGENSGFVNELAYKVGNRRRSELAHGDGREWPSFILNRLGQNIRRHHGGKCDSVDFFAMALECRLLRSG